MKLTVSDFEMEVRAATAEDTPLLLSFIRKLGEFEKLEVLATEEDLERSLFGENPAARTLLAFVDDEPVAYVVYFFTFATMVGKRGLWLDDMFVNPEFRGKGVAKALMAYLADIAANTGCARFEWMVLDWNTKAIDFYKGLGASVHDDWRICRLEESEFKAVAEGLVLAKDDG